MHGLEEIIFMIDRSLSTKKRRHLAGGILMSVSLFFGGLAITIMTLKTEEVDDVPYLE